MNYGDQHHGPTAEEALRQRIRNETIDELCTWLHSCLAQVDPNSEVYKACTAMVNAMAGKKTPITATLGTGVDTLSGEVVTHYPLSQK